MIPMLVVTPLTFLGGSFYSVNMLPSGWRTITLLNPVVYLISGFRWSFYEIADVSVTLSRHDAGLLVACMIIVWWIFKTGYFAEELTREKASDSSGSGVVVVIAAHDSRDRTPNTP
jgi:ABC-type polysaccharide/polyol phosphate export permease